MRRKNYTNLFTEAKSRVTPNEAAERCGLTPNRGGYILCPFHDDHSPSMKVYPDGFHCFSCGTHTDVIGLVAHCRNISPYAAAKALHDREHISVDKVHRMSSRSLRSNSRDVSSNGKKNIMIPHFPHHT